MIYLSKYSDLLIACIEISCFLVLKRLVLDVFGLIFAKIDRSNRIVRGQIIARETYSRYINW